jgi:hypothetical protein
MTAIIEALSIIGELGDSDINQELLIFSAYIIARIDENDLLRMDREVLENQKRRLEHLIGCP